MTDLQKASSNPNIDCFQLDVMDKESISKFIKDISSQFENKITCFVNNAAIYEDGWNQSLFNKTLQTNIYGPIEITQNLLNNGCFAEIAQIVNVSSGYGTLNNVSKEYGNILTNECKTVQDLINKIKFDAKSSMAGSYMPCYKLSKAMLNRFTEILANDIEQNIQNNGLQENMNQDEEKKSDNDGNNKSVYSLYKKIYVNCVCPGWVRTQMGGAFATRSVQEGAASIMWLINQDINKLYKESNNAMPNGSFLRDGKIISYL